MSEDGTKEPTSVVPNLNDPEFSTFVSQVIEAKLTLSERIETVRQSITQEIRLLEAKIKDVQGTCNKLGHESNEHASKQQRRCNICHGDFWKS